MNRNPATRYMSIKISQVGLLLPMLELAPDAIFMYMGQLIFWSFAWVVLVFVRTVRVSLGHQLTQFAGLGSNFFWSSGCWASKKGPLRVSIGANQILLANHAWTLKSFISSIYLLVVSRMVKTSWRLMRHIAETVEVNDNGDFLPLRQEVGCADHVRQGWMSYVAVSVVICLFTSFVYSFLSVHLFIYSCICLFIYSIMLYNYVPIH